MTTDRLIIRGAREHNLKDVSLDLPRNALIVFTGLSGSGKSSLAFDTIFAEVSSRLNFDEDEFFSAGIADAMQLGYTNVDSCSRFYADLMAVDNREASTSNEEPMFGT